MQKSSLNIEQKERAVMIMADAIKPHIHADAMGDEEESWCELDLSRLDNGMRLVIAALEKSGFRILKDDLTDSNLEISDGKIEKAARAIFEEYRNQHNIDYPYKKLKSYDDITSHGRKLCIRQAQIAASIFNEIKSGNSDVK